VIGADDRAELLDLIARYAHAVDRRDVPAVVECFASGGRLEFASTATVLHGHAEITDFYERAFAGTVLGGAAASTHLMSNTVITAPAGDVTVTTEAIAYLATSAVVDHADSATSRVLVRGLTYTDRCVRERDRWVFAERVHRLHWQGEMPGGPVTADPLGPTPSTSTAR
jgi:hypothetical protein